MDKLKERVDTLEGKHSFLEICHSELANRNHLIKSQLNNLIDKEKNLECLLIFALKNFNPSFFMANEVKYLEGFTTDPNSQIVEKSSYQKNDVINKIFKEIKNLIQCYYIVNNEKNEQNPKINENEFIQTNNITKNNEDLPQINNIMKNSIPRKSSLQIIENNSDSEMVEKSMTNNNELLKNNLAEFINNLISSDTTELEDKKEAPSDSLALIKNKRRRSQKVEEILS